MSESLNMALGNRPAFAFAGGGHGGGRFPDMTDSRPPSGGKVNILKSVPEETVDNVTGDVGRIVENSKNGMHRKVERSTAIEPMPRQQLQKIVEAFKRQGGIIQMDDATDLYLQSRKAEAITYNESTILLMQNPGRASVFEELIHATQFRKCLNDGSPMSRIKNEIAAQEMLLKNSKVYKLTFIEIKQTESALNACIRELQELPGGL
jgi:hypothetical protein